MNQDVGVFTFDYEVYYGLKVALDVFGWTIVNFQIDVFNPITWIGESLLYILCCHHYPINAVASQILKVYSRTFWTKEQVVYYVIRWLKDKLSDSQPLVLIVFIET